VLFDTSYRIKQKIVQCFDQECERYQKRGGEKVFSLSFLGPSSPKLTSSSPGPPNVFRVKEPAHLGMPVTSGLSFSSPGRATSPPK